MEYFVADSYTGFELVGAPYEKSGKMYSKARAKCDRCTKGVYVSHVENGQIVPHPAYGGVCLKCNGTGLITKEVRLYTEKEKAAMDRAKERAAERKVEERLSQAENKKKEWLRKNHFTENGVMTIYVGADSFDVKGQLREEGWKYSPILGWHIGEIGIDKYPAENLVEVSVENLAVFNLYGEGCWLSAAKNFVDQIRESRRPQPKSEWIGVEKDKIKNIPVVVKRISGCSTQYGWTNIITFLNGENILTWFTSTDCKFAEGESCYLSASVKSHTEYKGEKQTVITRAKLTSEEI